MKETQQEAVRAQARTGNAKETRRNKGGGYLYVITNPAWPPFVKIGRTTNINSRLRTYQTGDPNRGYFLHYYRYFLDVCKAERTLSTLYQGVERQGEWYQIHAEDAANLIDLTAAYLRTADGT